MMEGEDKVDYVGLLFVCSKYVQIVLKHNFSLFVKSLNYWYFTSLVNI